MRIYVCACARTGHFDVRWHARMRSHLHLYQTTAREAPAEAASEHTQRATRRQSAHRRVCRMKEPAHPANSLGVLRGLKPGCPHSRQLLRRSPARSERLHQARGFQLSTKTDGSSTAELYRRNKRMQQALCIPACCMPCAVCMLQAAHAARCMVRCMLYNICCQLQTPYPDSSFKLSSAPAASSIEITSVWPTLAAMCNAVLLPCPNPHAMPRC